MPRAYHYPQRHPVTQDMGHWEATIQNGRVVDVWYPHCPLHIFTVPPCEHCAAVLAASQIRNTLATTDEGEE